MYCRNCGKSLAVEAEICMGCGVQPPRGGKFCQSCGAEVSPLAEMCVKCGARLGKRVSKGKSKTASVLLAVFLGYWTWLYTHGKDAWKFWTCLVVDSVATGLMVWGLNELMMGSYYYSYGQEAVVGVGVGGAIQLAVWVWAIVDAAHRSSEWYKNYPNI